MALRDKLRERVGRFLEPGEQVRHVFLAQTGPSPYWLFLTYIVFFWTRFYIVVATDRRVAVFRAGFWTQAKPKRWHQQYPRATRLGAPLSGLWGKAHVGGEAMYVHKRFHKDVAAADAEVAGAGFAAPGAVPSSWAPTHKILAPGVSVWTTPDPSLAPAATLPAGLAVRVVEQRGDWVRIVHSDGGSGWVDGRLLGPMTA